MDPQSTVGVYPRITPPLIRMDEADAILTHIEDSLDMRERLGIHRIWQEIEQNILVRPSANGMPNFTRYGPSASHAYFQAPPSRAGFSILKDPESHQINETLTAQGLQILLGPPDYLTAAPRGWDDPEKARMLARMLMAVLDQPGNYGTMYRSFKDSFGYGISYLQVGYAEMSRMQVVQVPMMDETGQPALNPETGMPVMSYEPRPVMFRQGPRIDVIDHYDIYPDPNGTRIHVDMEMLVKRFRVSPAMAMDLAEAGVYDMEATKRALSKHGDGRPSTAAPHGDERFQSFAENRGANRNIVYGFEAYGRLPVRYPDGASNRMVTMLNGEIVRSHINPYMDGEIPILEVVVNPMTGRHYGYSPLEAVRYLQDSTDSMLMTLTDAADKMVRPSLLIGNFGGDINQVRRRDGDILCRDPKMIAAMPTDFNAITVAQSEMARRKQSMREASGATNPMQAIPSSDRATATEISTLTQFASNRIDVMVRLIERDNMPILGRLIHSRLRQFLPPNSDIHSVLNGEPITVPFETIDADADVRFGGSRLFATKFQQALQYEKFMQILGTQQMLIMTAPELVVRYARDILGIEDAEQIVTKMMMRQAIVMQSQTQAAAGPQGAVPTTGGTDAGAMEVEGAAVA